MIEAHGIPLAVWLGYWRYKARYHRYTVDGLDRLARSPASLIVGYHGRPAAWDMCMLTVALHDRLGYLPHAIFNGAIDDLPGARWLADSLGFVGEDGEPLKEFIARGEHLVVTPGAANEGSRTFRERYRVEWAGHKGYLRLAIKHHLPIVPVGASGTDDAYFGLVNGVRTAKRVGLPRGWSLWTGVGLGGLFPFAPAFPVKIHQIIGDPIRPWIDDEARLDDPESLERAHQRVMGAVQGLLDRARGLGYERPAPARRPRRRRP